jgi:hypothetical protein
VNRKHLLLSMMGLTAYPLAFPQITRLVTGLCVTDPRFQNAHRRFLQSFARLLRGAAPARTGQP